MNTHTTDDSQNVPNASVSALREQDLHTPPLDPNAPRVPFKTALKLTRKQEDGFVEWLFQKYTDMDKELGRSETDTEGVEPGTEWFTARASLTQEEKTLLFDTFFGKRLIQELTYRNKLEWRKSIPNALFRQSNLTLSSARRITNQRIARFTRFFFEETPWFALTPTGTRGDREFARKLAKLADIKMQDSGSASEFRQAITQACVIGEAVLHTGRVVDDDHFLEELSVLLDTAGAPILAGDGDYITEEDKWTAAPQMLPAEAMKPGEASTELVEDTAHEILARDPSTSKRGRFITTPTGTVESARYEMQVVQRRAVHYIGAKTSLVYYRDFLCPLGANDVQGAECIVHLERLPLSEVAQRYAANPQAETIRQAVDLILAARSSGESSQYAADAPRSRVSLGETNVESAPVSDVLNVGHFYCKADPMQTGITSDIYCLMDMDSRIPIYYHFTAVASPTRRRPYRVVRTTAVNGRWFGYGEMEQFGDASNLIDIHLNRAAITQSRSGRIIGWKPERTLEGQKNPNLRIEWGDTVTPTGDWTLQDCFQVEYLNDNKSAELKNTLELLNQALTNESGTASANDASAAGLDTQKTATGIKSLDNSGNELTSLPVSVLREGLTQALDDFILTTFRFHDTTETFTILEGDVPVEMQLQPADISNLRVNVQVLMTAYHNDQEQNRSANSLAIGQQWTAAVLQDPKRALQQNPLYVRALENQGEEDAAKLLPPPDAEDFLAAAANQQDKAP